MAVPNLSGSMNHRKTGSVSFTMMNARGGDGP